jgi:tetraacyldisaccharide 4'-kinase
VVVTRATRVDEALARRIESLHGRAPIAWTSHAWTGVRVQSGDADRTESVAWLHGRRLSVWAGIGNPQTLHAQVRRTGAEVVHAPALRDHHVYRRADVKSLLEHAAHAGAEAVLCTPKDWVKVRELLPAGHMPVVRPTLVLTCLQGGEALRDAVRAALDAGDSRRRR